VTGGSGDRRNREEKRKKRAILLQKQGQLRGLVRKLPKLLGILELHILHGGCKLMLIRQQNMPRILQSGS